MKPKPSKTLIALWSIASPPRSLNSGYSTAPTTIIPATKQAARKANKITNRRPIRAMALDSLSRHCEERSDEAIQLCHRGEAAGLLRFARNDGGDGAALHEYSIRHRHGAQRL